MSRHPPPEFEPRPIAPTWRQRLLSARTPGEVCETCLEYVARITPAELQYLPRRCWPPRRLDEESIAEYAVELARVEREMGPRAPSQVRALAVFFGDATAVLARLAAHLRRTQWGPSSSLRT